MTSVDRHGFTKLVAASTISNVGDGVFLVALPLLATDLTRDPTAIAGVVLAMRLPWLVSTLIAGEVADRVDRRHLIWRTDTASRPAGGACRPRRHRPVPDLTAPLSGIGRVDSVIGSGFRPCTHIRSESDRGVP